MKYSILGRTEKEIDLLKKFKIRECCVLLLEQENLDQENLDGELPKNSLLQKSRIHVSTAQCKIILSSTEVEEVMQKLQGKNNLIYP